MASRIPRDNNGVVIGSREPWVIDSGINGAVAKLQERVRKLIDEPLLYVINTNYYGDHTFGNYAFPSSVEIVAHRETRDSMSDFAAEKQIRTRNLFGNEPAIADARYSTLVWDVVLSTRGGTSQLYFGNARRMAPDIDAAGFFLGSEGGALRWKRSLR